MTTHDKLPIEECERMAECNGIVGELAKQLADTMRENERLLEAIKPIAAWPIVANGRVTCDENEWNDVVIKARQALSNKDSSHD